MRVSSILLCQSLPQKDPKSNTGLVIWGYRREQHLAGNDACSWLERTAVTVMKAMPGIERILVIVHTLSRRKYVLIVFAM